MPTFEIINLLNLYWFLLLSNVFLSISSIPVSMSAYIKVSISKMGVPLFILNSKLAFLTPTLSKSELFKLVNITCL